jgi:hypothetical protein
MAEASDDLGIPMKPPRPGGGADNRSGQAAGDAAPRAGSGVGRRSAPSRRGAAPPHRLDLSAQTRGQNAPT